MILAGFRTFHFGHFVSDNTTTVLPYRTMHICDQNQENLLSIKFSHIERVKPRLSEIVYKHISFCLYALILIHLHCMCSNVIGSFDLQELICFSYCKAVIFKIRCNQKVAYSPWNLNFYCFMMKYAFSCSLIGWEVLSIDDTIDNVNDVMVVQFLFLCLMHAIFWEVDT